MKLDRNINPNGHGKYALVHIRKLRELSPENQDVAEKMLDFLADHGVLKWGNESPGDQFFVMKYKDRFAHEGLSAYASAVREYAHINLDVSDPKQSAELLEYAKQIYEEAAIADRLGNRTPD